MSNTPEVLIVDDEESFCTALLKRLTFRNIPAHAVHNGEDALKEIMQNSYNVILLDLKMDGISGIEVLQQIRTMGSKAEVIILSGHASLDTAMEVLQYGAYDYLLKPYDLDDLLVKIISAYEQYLEKQKFH